MNDVTIIGGGIVGMATALEVQRRWPGMAVRLLEKERSLGAHQTGRNSGVIHAGIYYAPGSLKAQFCREGLSATVQFCKDYALPVEQCGKLLVATTEDEVTRLNALTDRAVTNGLDVRAVSAAELREIEPNISGLAALLSPATGITDYGAIVQQMAQLFVEGGGEISMNSNVVALDESANGVRLLLSSGEALHTNYVVACAGLQADRIAALSGLNDDFAIVPFKGEYFRLAPRHDTVVRHLIYPVPDPALPFLGVHLTRMSGGFVTVGPNAVLSLSREGYRKFAPSLRDLKDMAVFPGFWRTLFANIGAGVSEAANSALRSRYLALCQRYCPSIELSDLQPHPPGIRAQAVLRDGTLVHDFLIKNTHRTIHVCNAPSPAATSAIPIARHIAGLAAKNFRLKG